jgi:RNA polymerase sigma-70 factor (ECF subfamily)
MTAVLSAEMADRLDRLYRLHAPHVARVARARTRDPHAADDVAAETWARAAASLHQFRGADESAGPWLAAIAVHAAVDHYRPRRAAERPADWGDPLTSRALPASASAEVLALADSDAGPIALALLRAVADLPEAQRVAVELRADGLSFRAMASHARCGRFRVEHAYRRGAAAVRARVGHGLAATGGGR